MLEVFHRSGFQVHETLEHGYVQLAFSVEPTEASVARSELLDRLFTTASLRPALPAHVSGGGRRLARPRPASALESSKP